MKNWNAPIRIASTMVAGAIMIGCSSTPLVNDHSSADTAVRRIVESFRTSIIHKDKASFMRLFFSDKPEMITWQAVVDGPSLATIQRTSPQAIKARHRPDNNFLAFIDGVVASAHSEEEQFADVRVDTDGEVASVSFDYVYVSDGRETNRGREKWLLVRTEQGWKITSVVYTIRLPKASN